MLIKTNDILTCSDFPNYHTENIYITIYHCHYTVVPRLLSSVCFVETHKRNKGQAKVKLEAQKLPS